MRLFPVCAFLLFTTLVSQSSFGKTEQEVYTSCLDKLRDERKQQVEAQCLSTSKFNTETDEGIPVGSSPANSVEQSGNFSKCMSGKDLEPTSAQTQACFDRAFKSAKAPEKFDSGDAECAEPPCVSTAAATPIPKARPADSSAPGASNPKSNNSPTTSATSTPRTTPTTSQNSGNAQAQVQQDIQQCQSLQSQATRCCGNPASCSSSLSSADQQNLSRLMQANNGPAQGQGMTDYCNQLNQASSNSGSLNNKLAGICASSHSSCTSTCNSLGDRYIDLANANLGSSSESIYASASDQLYNLAAQCGRLQAQANQLAQQGVGSGSTSGYASTCQQMAAANPQNPASKSNPVPNHSAATNASLDPTQNQNKENSGTSAFADTAKNMGSFDVPVVAGGNYAYGGNSQKPSAAAQVKSVSNNTGGGFGGNGSITTAQLGGGNNRPSPGSPGYTTDILQGAAGGGGYTQPSGSGFEDNSNRNSNYAQQSRTRGDDSGMLGVDLRKYLPGGSRDPHRQLAGMGRLSEINAKEEDIWRRISNKMVEKCKLGILWKCQ